jgi:hypothetical protein
MREESQRNFTPTPNPPPAPPTPLARPGKAPRESGPSSYGSTTPPVAAPLHDSPLHSKSPNSFGPSCFSSTPPFQPSVEFKAEGTLGCSISQPAKSGLSSIVKHIRIRNSCFPSCPIISPVGLSSGRPASPAQSSEFSSAPATEQTCDCQNRPRSRQSGVPDHPRRVPPAQQLRRGSRPRDCACVCGPCHRTSRALHRAGLPATFVTDLNNRITAVEASAQGRNTGLLSQVGGTAGIDVAARRGLAALRELDGIMSAALKDNEVLLAAWNVAKHIERRNPAPEPAPAPSPSGS